MLKTVFSFSDGEEVELSDSCHSDSSEWQTATSWMEGRAEEDLTTSAWQKMSHDLTPETQECRGRRSSRAAVLPYQKLLSRHLEST